MDLPTRAALFASRAHAGQRRKYTGELYITHPAAVVELVQSVPHTPEMLAAAWCHDVCEDTSVTIDEIVVALGLEVADLVDWLTDVSMPSHGNRAARKAIDRAHLAGAPAAAQTIKLADLIDNTRSIVEHDPDFAIVYLREKAALLDVLIKGDPALMAIARETLSRTSPARVQES